MGTLPCHRLPTDNRDWVSPVARSLTYSLRMTAKRCPTALGHDVSKQTAQVPQINTQETIVPQQEISTGPQQEHNRSRNRPLEPLPAPDNGSVAAGTTSVKAD